MFAKRIPAQLAQLLAMMAEDPAHKIDIVEIPEGANVDEFMAKFLAEQEAKHRENCADCAAAHNEAQAKAAYDAELAMKKAQAAMPNDVRMGTASTRQPIGYMVFATIKDETRPVPGSFHIDHADVEAKLAKYLDSEVLKKTMAIANILGVEVPAHEIRHVFGD